MKLLELFEGRVKNLAIDREYNRQHGSGPTNTKQQMSHAVVINGKQWKDFPDEPSAMRAANGLYAKNPRLRVSVITK